MQIAFKFNWPPQQDKVEVTFGEQNDADDSRQFRIGLIKAGEERDAVHWSMLGWVGGTETATLNQLDIEAVRGDVVRVERRDRDGEVTFFEVPTEENWPAGAYGNQPITVTWGFED